MEPLHEFNPCQELSPPLQQKGFPSPDLAEDPPIAGKRKEKRTRTHDYDRRVRNAVKFIRRAALADVDIKEAETSGRMVDVGGRSLAWAVGASAFHRALMY